MKMEVRIQKALKQAGAERVKVFALGKPGWFNAEMNPLYPEDRHDIGERVAKKLGLTVEGGGTFLAPLKGQKATSDITFSVKRKRKK